MQEPGLSSDAVRQIPERVTSVTTSPDVSTDDFRTLLYDSLLPAFCSDPLRNYSLSSFRDASLKVSDYDAGYFLKAWRAGLFRHLGRGLYRAPRSFASEQFFWQGSRTSEVRTFTFWHEPVITVGALGRLHNDFGWPAHLLGSQSEDWAFDATAFLSEAGHEHIACEVKKTVPEIEKLVGNMRLLGEQGQISETDVPKNQLNAFRKVAALRARRAPVFWAVGPGGESRVFRIVYGSSDTVEMVEADETVLHFPGTAQRSTVN